MADLEINKNKLGKAIKLSGNIKNDLSDAYEEAQALGVFLKNAKWKGRTKDAFQTYIEIIIKYHGDLNDIMVEHEKVIEGLWQKIEDYRNSEFVNRIKGL